MVLDTFRKRNLSTAFIIKGKQTNENQNHPGFIQ